MAKKQKSASPTGTARTALAAEQKIAPLKGWHVVEKSFSGAPAGRYHRDPPGTWRPFVRKLSKDEDQAAEVLFGTTGKANVMLLHR